MPCSSAVRSVTATSREQRAPTGAEASCFIFSVWKYVVTASMHRIELHLPES